MHSPRYHQKRGNFATDLAKGPEIPGPDAGRPADRPDRGIRRAPVHGHDRAGWRLSAVCPLGRSATGIRPLRAEMPGDCTSAPVRLHSVARADPSPADDRPSLPQRGGSSRVVLRRPLLTPSLRLAMEPASDHASAEQAVQSHPQPRWRREPPQCPQGLLRPRAPIHRGQHLLVARAASLPGLPGVLSACPASCHGWPGDVGAANPQVRAETGSTPVHEAGARGANSVPSAAAPDYGAMSAAMAAFGAGPPPEIPLEMHPPEEPHGQ